MLNNKVLEFVEANKELQLGLLKRIVLIPSPSHFEGKRAEFCVNYLKGIGAENAYIDEAKNVIIPMCCENSNELTVIEGHIDTVFPMDTPLNYVDDGKNIYCPGISDDVISVTDIILTVKFFIEKDIKPKNGILFVLNSCEEGLGNLKGTKTLLKNYEGRIKRFISFDSDIPIIIDDCVGSHRYKVTAKTEGGHSYSSFGNENAISKLSQIISDIYAIEVPNISNSKTTYNVGTISGGTSVNSIAQSAEMLCEYRSNNYECLQIMKEEFERIFNKHNTKKCKLVVELIGERPCSNNVDRIEINKLKKIYSKIILELSGITTRTESASTDCNVPLSMGIPAIAVGVSDGFNVHTTEEYLCKETIITGLNAAIRFALELSK